MLESSYTEKKSLNGTAVLNWNKEDSKNKTKHLDNTANNKNVLNWKTKALWFLLTLDQPIQGYIVGIKDNGSKVAIAFVLRR